MKTRWLDRRIAAPGPYLALCLNENEFKAALRSLKIEDSSPWISNEWSSATTHHIRGSDGRAVVLVCMGQWEGRNPIEVAGLLVHEAVHVWQGYCEDIGEDEPGREQEAYAIQSIAQELMAEFARRME